MTEEKNPMLARIRALLAKAESSEFEAEAELLRGKAAALAAKYNIDQAMLAASGEKPETAADVQALRVEFAGSYTMEKMNLFATLARALDMQAIGTSRSGRAYDAQAYGFPAERQLLEVLYTSLLLQSDRELRRAIVPAHLYGRQVVTWRRSWLIGFAMRIGMRLREQRATTVREHDRASAPGSTGAELVLISRSQVVAQVVGELHPGLKQAKRKVSLDRHAVREGAKAGDRADLGGGKLDTGPRAAIASGR